MPTKKDKEFCMVMVVVLFILSLMAFAYTPTIGKVSMKGFMKTNPYIVLDDGTTSGVVFVDFYTFSDIEIGDTYDLNCRCIVGKSYRNGPE